MTDPRFVDISGIEAPALDLWEPLVFPAERITTEIERLAAIPPPADGRRATILAHPRSESPGLGLTPGIRVVLSVLLPGERTIPIRHNSTLIDFCIQGSGSAWIGGKQIDFGQYDVWNTPSYRPYCYVNETEHLQVRVTYSNAPLLEKLNIHLVETVSEELVRTAVDGAESAEFGGAGSTDSQTIPLGNDGAFLMPYEELINPLAVRSHALHWPWPDVKDSLDRLDALGSDYVGRRLYLLYNPMTGRTNGTTPSFFATITIRPPGIVDRPHRHISAAINYIFRGTGYSRIGGRLYRWKAGDLVLTAPGWTTHHHASDEHDVVYELTIQDQPLNIAMESLLWQEDMRHPPRVLGSKAGFTTNRSEIEE